VKPVLRALVLADRIYTDLSGKKIIAGTFSRYFIATNIDRPVFQNPDGTTTPGIMGGTDPGCPWLYVNLTDVVNGTEITLQLVSVSKNRALLQMPIKIQIDDRLESAEIVVPLPHMGPFIAKEAGVFSIDVVWRGEIIGSHRLVVEHHEMKSEEGNNENS
jgi:hypothetical protein